LERDCAGPVTSKKWVRLEIIEPIPQDVMASERKAIASGSF